MQERRSLKLSKEEWAGLEALAVRFETDATAGTKSGSPSWRALIKAVANGKIELKEKSE